MTVASEGTGLHTAQKNSRTTVKKECEDVKQLRQSQFVVGISLYLSTLDTDGGQGQQVQSKARH
jgi:hypothetical protein